MRIWENKCPNAFWFFIEIWQWHVFVWFTHLKMTATGQGQFVIEKFKHVSKKYFLFFCITRSQVNQLLLNCSTTSKTPVSQNNLTLHYRFHLEHSKSLQTHAYTSVWISKACALFQKLLLVSKLPYLGWSFWR